MQFKLKQNASYLYLQENQSKIDINNSDEYRIFEFLQQNDWKNIFCHKIIEDNVELSKYDIWTKFIVPTYCIDIEEVIEKEETKKIDKLENFFKRFYKDIIIITLLLSIFFTTWYEPKKDNNKIEKTVIETLIEKQNLNLKRVWSKFETQKIIKSQIKDLQNKLDTNIAEIKQIELENANIKEQIIIETNK